MSEVCVRVAVRVRPLLPREVLHRHQVCVRVVPGSSQVMLGSDRLFSFDHAFEPTASQDEVYESCVQPLVESLVDGYNATVFCYGQTGSGKTYTLGGGRADEEEGIIDHVAQDLFLLLEEKRKSGDCEEVKVRASYIELYKEELRDLLDLHTIHKELHIREDERGNTVVVGAKEVVISSEEELFSVLETGNAVRHTAATGMNEHSSRSHAILTLQVFLSHHNNRTSLTSVRSSKLCLVDLAGSERAGKTGNTGVRIKESAHINTGLLALGNVIRALSEPGRNRRGTICGSPHIPYRDAKITRILRDSLGGTAHTLMVACVSPSHHYFTETLSVLQFASKARQIRNIPGAASIQTEVKTCPATWHPDEARLRELDYELQTLRGLLREKEKEVEQEKGKIKERDGDGEKSKESSQLNASEPDEKVNQEEAPQYRLLAEEAAIMLADITCSSQSSLFRQRLQDWQKRLTDVTHSDGTDHEGYSEKSGEPHNHLTMFRLREELNRCQDALRREEQQLEKKDAELKQVQKSLVKLLQERETLLKASEEERERSRLQTEQLVNQQILVDHLRSEIMAFRGKSSDTSEDSDTSGSPEKRPHSVPLIGHGCRPPRKIHSSPPAYSLERVMAAFKMRGHLLLAEIEERDEVYCPFVKQQAKSKDGDQDEEQDEDPDDVHVSKTGLRHSLNRTWTSHEKKSALKERNAEQNPTCDGDQVIPQPHRAAGSEENQLLQNKMRKAKIRASVTERRIQDLSVNMRMKEELIKELDKTDRETKAVDPQGFCGDARQTGLLARLSIQSQQVRSEMYHSLQHMRLQKAQLQTSLSQVRQTSDGSQKYHLNAEQTMKDVYSWSHQEKSKEKLSDRSWLEEEEEKVLRKIVELQELEEDLRKREEVLQRREACLQEKSKLEIKKLRSSQALSQDLLHVSMQLESMEEKLQRSRGARNKGGVTIAELEEEREMLKKQRDALDDQLRENRVLTVEEEHCILQLEEAIEALDAAVEFKNHSIQDKEKKLLVSESSLHQSQSSEPVHLYEVIRKLRELSHEEAVELLIKYFKKVVCLREVEHHLRLRCEELELHAGEKEAVLREMEAAMQRLTLDTDRRLTQQHRDHLNTIQQLLQKLKEGDSGEAQQVIQDRLQHLEKELFFYKSTSRQLKKKLREVLSDALHPDSQPSQMQPLCTVRNQSHTDTEEAQSKTLIPTTYTKVHAENTDNNTHSLKSRRTQHTQSLFSPSVLRETKVPESNQTRSESHCGYVKGRSGESMEKTPVRLCRRELRQISAPEVHISSSATRKRQSVVDTGTESMAEDSIEVPRNR